MNIPSSEIISLLYVLLPGFLAATVFHALTPYPKRDVVDRVVTALIFTLFAQLTVSLIREILLWLGDRDISVGTWGTNVDLMWGAIVGIGIGIVWSTLINWGLPHSYLQAIGITKKTSMPTPWFNALGSYERFVVLNLDDGRRLMGWPLQWPDEPTTGHFLLEEPAWIVDGKEIRLDQIEVLLFPVESVREIEFLRFNDDDVLEVRSKEIGDTIQSLISLREENGNGRKE